MKNKNMHKAKRNKKDEFYTQMTDIQRELFQYRHHFKGKKIFLNCDDPEYSHFWLYFTLNFDFFGLKKLTATHYEVDKPSYKLEMVKYQETTRTTLEGNGDFRSPEAVAILEDSDIVITNPPFSLFREHIGQLMEYKKKFVVIGNQNAITYKEVFRHIKDKKMWLGTKSNIVMEFRVPESYESINGVVKVPAINWFTNLDHKRRNEELILYKKYYGNEKDYPRYDNYDAINVDKVADIPCDYEGVMGVPITFLGKHNPKQFEVLGLDDHRVLYPKLAGCNSISGKKIYRRLIIKNKNPKAGI